jgi:hypothetical protein
MYSNTATRTKTSSTIAVELISRGPKTLRDIVRQDPAARTRFDTADQQKNAVIEAALDPLLVAGHEFAGLPFVDRKSKQHDEHLLSAVRVPHRPPIKKGISSAIKKCLVPTFIEA